MEMVIGWLVFAIVVGILGDQRGRSGLSWGFLAAIISPLLAGIILFIIPNLKAEAEKKKAEQIAYSKEEEKQEREEAKQKLEDSKISGPDYLLSFEKLHQLSEKGILTELEYSGRKLKLIDELRHQTLTDTPENFLGTLVPLLDNSILNQEEMSKIKAIVFK
jgi:hypothetical protein